MGLALVVVLGVVHEDSASLGTAGGWANAVGRLTGLVGTYGLLVMVVLVARLQFVERVVGQDRLVKWHRWIAPGVLALLVAHTVANTIGYARAAERGVAREFWTLLTTTGGMLTATVGLAALLVASATSYRVAKRHLSYETWWVIHLYTYLGIGLSYSHVLSSGSAFVGEPVARGFWIALWLLTAGLVAWYRVLLPTARSAYHAMRVESVVAENADTVSITVVGRRLDRLPIHGGQFLQWRFLKAGLWWQAHPYSISSLPTRTTLRFTVKRLGDHSAALLTVEPGTRVAIEGPYGTFTRHRLRLDRVLLVGAGVGVTPVRALLEDLPGGVDVTVLLRADRHEDLVLADEVERFVDEHGGRAVTLVGPPDEVPIDAPALRAAVPDVADREVYMCGPTGFMRAMSTSLRESGVPPERIHHEAFTF